jgi:sugar phosphate isomerase/epimerase
MKALRIGIDSYGLIPLHLSPLQLLEWAKDNGAEGVQFSGLSQDESQNIDEAYLEDMAQYASSQNLYLEWGGGQHIPFDMETWGKKDIIEVNRKAAREAAILGTHIVRSCSGGLMRWNPESPQTEMLLEAMANSLRSQRQMLKDHNVILAIETHFEFTTHELLRLFEQCNAEPGDYLGICLDTMNLLTMLEHPVKGTKRILPWVVSTHIKDGAVLLNSEGLVTFPVEIGKGVIRIREIVDRIASLPYEVHLTIEDHGGSFLLPIYDSRFLSKFPDLTLQEFVSLIQMGHQAAEAVRAGEMAITGREKWPEICESRIKQDMLSLRKLLDL